MRVELPIETSALQFLVSMPPEPLLDRETKQQRAVTIQPVSGLPRSVAMPRSESTAG